MKRQSTAVWNCTGKEGKGKLTSTSGVLNETPYSFTTRFISEDSKAGTNPEELIAVAHARCFSMALSFQLGGAGFTLDELHTDAIVNMENVEGHFIIQKIDLILEAKISGISESKFLEIANNAKKTCPVSQALLAVEITLSASLL